MRLRVSSSLASTSGEAPCFALSTPNTRPNCLRSSFRWTVFSFGAAAFGADGFFALTFARCAGFLPFAFAPLDAPPFFAGRRVFATSPPVARSLPTASTAGQEWNGRMGSGQQRNRDRAVPREAQPRQRL